MEPTFDVFNIDYTVNSTNIYRAKKQMKNNKQTKKFKSINQQSINQNINPLGRPGT